MSGESTDPAVDEAPGPPVAVDLDLDTLERDGSRPGPYRIRLSGQVFEFQDPRDIDWQDLVMAQRNPLLFLKFCLGEEQYKLFSVLPLPDWGMEKLMKGFFRHFGMGDSPEVSALLR